MIVPSVMPPRLTAGEPRFMGSSVRDGRRDDGESDDEGGGPGDGEDLAGADAAEAGEPEACCGEEEQQQNDHA